jgi:hypothetical protein
MAAKTYDGFRITELRNYAKEYAIPGRSKMNGDELLAAVQAVWDARRVAQEQLVIGAVKVGALLRHKSSGYVIRVTSELQTWQPYGSLFVTAEYVTHDGWGESRQAERAAYMNENDKHRAARGEIVRHPIWQYEAISEDEQAEAVAAELTEAQRLLELRRGIAEPAAAPAPQTIVEGSTVVRRDDPTGPRGEVTKVEAGWGHAWVIFAGLLPATRVRLSALRLAPEAGTSCGQPWVAEIELCPRCGLDASRHPRRSADELQRDEARPQVGALLDLAEIRDILTSGQAPEAIAVQIATIAGGAGGALDRIEAALRS